MNCPDFSPGSPAANPGWANWLVFVASAFKPGQ